jgi:hypothetical protein
MQERRRFVFENESGASLSPLSLKGIDTVTIETALDHLKDDIEDLETFNWVAGEFLDNKFGQKFPHNLTRCEAIAVRLYTVEWTTREDSLYYKMCQALRSANRQSIKPYLHYLKLLLCGLNKFPSHISHNNTLWRGVIDDDGKIASMYSEKLKKHWWWGFSSCSSDMTVVKQFLGDKKKVLFNIHFTSHAVDISELSYFPNESEIILFPARYLQVVNASEMAPGLTIVEMKEVTSPLMITGIELKKSIQPQLQPQIQPQLLPQHQPQLQPQHQTKFQPQHLPQIQPQIQPQLQTKFKPQIQPQLQPQLQTKFQPQLQPQLQTKFQPQLQPQIQPQLQPQHQPQLQPQHQPQLQPQLLPQLQTKLQPQQPPIKFCMEHRRELNDWIRGKMYAFFLLFLL